MEAHAHGGSRHHAMPTSGNPLTGVAVSATLHCLTGCAIGEILGTAIGTALGFSDWETVGLGRRHAVVHATGVHGGPSPRLVGTVLVVAFVFGSAVLVAEALDGGSGGGHEQSTQSQPHSG